MIDKFGRRIAGAFTRFSRVFIADRAQSRVTSRPMTAEEERAFDDAFKKMDDAFDAMSAAFRKVR